MNLINKLKIVAGFTSNKEVKLSEYNNYEVAENDTTDVVFAKKLIQNNGHFFYCDKEEELIKTIQGLTKKLNLNDIYCRESVLQELLTKSSIEYHSSDYLSCDAILSSCEYLIADHGKVMLSSQQLGPHNIKNLPKEHIIVAYTSQIVKNLNESMSGVNTRYIDNLPSTITTVTGKNKEDNDSSEGNIKNLSVLLIEDYNHKN